MKKKTNIIIILLLVLSAVALWFAFKPNSQEEVIQEEMKEEQPKEEKKEESPKPTVIGQEKETVKGDITDFKYGVKQQPVTYNTYDVYSDGEKVLVESVDNILFHHQGYNATMEQLRVEGEYAVATYMNQYEEFLNLINQARAQKGIAPLTLDLELCHVAGFRAAELEYSGKFSHERPDGSGCFAVTQYYGIIYKHLAETIAREYEEPKTILRIWEKDSDYLGYLMDTRFTKVGFGFSDAGIQKKWVAIFSD